MHLKPKKIVLSAAAAFFAFAGAASAQGLAPTFERMKAAPTDHENTFAYVEAATAARDYEAAIAALERILTYNPGLSRAEYELGVLYFRLKSYAQAVLHFETAQADGALDQAVRRRLEAFLIEARKQLSQSRFTGVLQLGYRYNSNVAGAPSFGLLRSFGADVPGIRRFRDRGDGSVFALGEVSHTYDFQNQRGDTWETRIAGYAAHQFSLTKLDVGLVEVATGPRLALAPGALPGWTVRPYASAGGSEIGGRGYGSNYGGGVALGIPVTPYFALEPGIDAQRIDIRRPGNGLAQATLNTGSLWTASLGATWSATEEVTFSAKAFARRNDASDGARNSNQFGAEASVKVEFAPPTDLIGMNWSVTPFARYLAVDFSRADPVVDPLVKRHDRQFRAGVQLDMPFTPYLGVNGAVQYTRNESNIANFRSTSWSFLIGPTARF